MLREVNGTGPDGRALSAYTALKADGSTACGCWIYTGVYADEVNQSMRRKPGAEQDNAAHEWGWAWPANRRVLYNRASADPEGRPWSERKKLIWWDGEKWTGGDVPDFPADKAPDYRPPEGARAGGRSAVTSRSSCRATGGPGCSRRPGWPTADADSTNRRSRRCPTRCTAAQRANPAREQFERPDNRYHPEPGTPGADVFPFVFHHVPGHRAHTAGGMSRWTPRLNELHPEMCPRGVTAAGAERGCATRTGRTWSPHSPR